MDAVVHPLRRTLGEYWATPEDRVSPRYHYGELRRTCIDTIYRFTPRFSLRYSTAEYFYEDFAAVFHKRQVAWLVVAFTMIVVLVVFVGLWIFDNLKAFFQAKKGMERRLQDGMGGGETRALI